MMILLWALVLGAQPTNISLEHQLTIGGEDDAYIFGMGTRLIVDDQGHMYVVDPRANAVKVLDASGKLLLQFGRKGEGPGEFEEPRSILLTEAGQLDVFDTTLKRKTRFNLKGEFQESIKLESSIVATHFAQRLEQDRVAFVSAKVDEQAKPVYDLSIYAADMKPIKSLWRVYPQQLDWSKSNQPTFWEDFLLNQLALVAEPMPLAAHLNHAGLVTANTQQYTLTFYDLDGEQVRQIQRKVKPKAFNEAAQFAVYEGRWEMLTADPFLANRLTQHVFERAFAKVDKPDALPMLKALLHTRSGFAVLYNYDEAKHQGQLAFHDFEGELLGETPFEGPAAFLTSQGDYLYAVGPDEMGDVLIHRYHIAFPAASDKK